MALSIVEAAKVAANNGEFKKAGVIMTFAEASPTLRAMPVLTINGNSYAYVRESELPTVAFRGVNQAYTPSEGKVETRTEVLKLLGGDLDVDRFLVQTNGQEIRTAHERMKATSMAQTIGVKLFKGDIGTTSVEFNGLQTRYGGATSIAAVAGRVIDNSNAALSMKRLDEAIDAVDRSIGTRVIVCNQAMRRNITAFLRGSGTAVQIDRDQFGQQLTSYNGLPILDADQNGDQAAIAFDENANTTTSVYVLALGPAGVHMIQSGGGIDVRDLGELNAQPVMRTRVEWYAGLCDEHPRCVTRIFNITNATAVA